MTATGPRAADARPLCARLARAVRTACLAALAVSCADGSDARPRPAHRLLLVGWDGATFDLIDPLVREGRLPHLAALAARGRSAVLESTVVPISSAAWVGAMTGRGPGQHGVYSFFEPVEDGRAVRLISSLSIRAPPLWRVLAARGLRVDVIGVPVTWPPEPLPGVMVAGMLSPPDAAYTWPPELAAELSARGFVPDLGVWREVQALDDAVLEQQLRLKQALVLERLAREDWDASIVVFKDLDVLSHRAYDGRTDGAVARHLERLDGVLGRMLEAAGPDAHVLLVSDHGFASYPHRFDLHAWLLQAGWAVAREDARELPVGRAPLAEKRVLEHERRLAGLDLARTRAVAAACEGNFGTLRLNLAGREPDGLVPADEADAALAALEAALAGLLDAEGRPLVVRTWRGGALYPGPWRDAVVPDLLFETRPDHLVTADGGAVLSTPRRPRADHTRDGVWILAGPSVPAATGRGRASIVDVAPTALHLLGLPVHAEMSGVARSEWLADPRPPAVVAEAGDPALRRARGDEAAYSDAQAEALAEQLRALGYTR